MTDPFVGQLTFIRVYSGHMKRDDLVHASATRKSLKLGPLLEVCGAESHPIDEAGPGDITSLPSGHDAWVVGDGPVVLVDWYGATKYAKAV